MKARFTATAKGGCGAHCAMAVATVAPSGNWTGDWLMVTCMVKECQSAVSIRSWNWSVSAPLPSRSKASVASSMAGAIMKPCRYSPLI